MSSTSTPARAPRVGHLRLRLRGVRGLHAAGAGHLLRGPPPAGGPAREDRDAAGLRRRRPGPRQPAHLRRPGERRAGVDLPAPGGGDLRAVRGGVVLLQPRQRRTGADRGRAVRGGGRVGGCRVDRCHRSALGGGGSPAPGRRRPVLRGGRGRRARPHARDVGDRARHRCSPHHDRGGARGAGRGAACPRPAGRGGHGRDPGRGGRRDDAPRRRRRPRPGPAGRRLQRHGRRRARPHRAGRPVRRRRQPRAADPGDDAHHEPEPARECS